MVDVPWIADYVQQIEVVSAAVKEVKCEDLTYEVFSFGLTCTIEDSTYKWTINKTFYEFQNLRQVLEKKRPSLEPLGTFTQFKLLLHEEQLMILQEFLSDLLSDSGCFSHPLFIEFIEVSYLSFTYETKMKEGYVYKVGSGRRANRGRYCNCYQHFQGTHRKWLRVTEHGLVYSADHLSPIPGELIEFSNSFTVLKGKDYTGFTDGIRIRSPTHLVTFRTGNSRHRDEFEKAILEARNLGGYSPEHIRFNSSYQIRSGNRCKWFADADGYFAAVYDALAAARNYVYITDWWMSPELYLKRPSKTHPETQLMRLLENLSDINVQVYILLFQEFRSTLSINSLHTKETLEKSRNVHVLRHPHFSIRGGEFLWSHHEKMVVVDGKIAFVGGLDLCYGRYDDNTHPLCDENPPHRWNGIDYSNVRIEDFKDVDQWTEPQINRAKAPRMPWHDIAMSIEGTVILDLEVHFRERWNHAVRDITGSKETRDIIVPPVKSVSAEFDYNETELLASRPISIKPQSMQLTENARLALRRTFRKQLLPTIEDESAEPSQQEETVDSQQDLQVSGLMSTPSAAILKHLVVQRLPQSPEVEEALRRKEERDIENVRKTRVNLENAIAQGVCVMLSQNASQGIESYGNCEAQLVRSAGLWSVGRVETERSIQEAYVHLIERAQHFIYIENQFFISNVEGEKIPNNISEALVNKIITSHFQGVPFKVIVVLPLLPGFPGGVTASGSGVLRIQLHHQYNTICRGGNSIYEQLSAAGLDPTEYIQFYGLRTHAVLDGVPVTEMIYVHSKLMIVDDQIVLMGSANINYRSLLGDRDSELAIVNRDFTIQESVMAGEQFEASKFAYSLRTALFREHSGEVNDEKLQDPLSPEFDQVWRQRARTNTEFYRDVFRCYPDDFVTRADMLDSFEKGARQDLYEQRVGNVVGHLVEFPLNFMQETSLQFKFTEIESKLPLRTFT